MAAAGIREASDVDLLDTKDLFAKLRESGWKQIHKAPSDEPPSHDVFDVHEHWDFSSYKPTLDQLLTSKIVIEGIPFASLQEVRKWKESSGRPKDLEDIKLIDRFMND